MFPQQPSNPQISRARTLEIQINELNAQLQNAPQKLSKTKLQQLIQDQVDSIRKSLELGTIYYDLATKETTLQAKHNYLKNSISTFENITNSYNPRFASVENAQQNLVLFRQMACSRFVEGVLHHTVSQGAITQNMSLPRIIECFYWCFYSLTTAIKDLKKIPSQHRIESDVDNLNTCWNTIIEFINDFVDYVVSRHNPSNTNDNRIPSAAKIYASFLSLRWVDKKEYNNEYISHIIFLMNLLRYLSNKVDFPNNAIKGYLQNKKNFYEFTQLINYLEIQKELLPSRKRNLNNSTILSPAKKHKMDLHSSIGTAPHVNFHRQPKNVENIVTSMILGQQGTPVHKP